MNVHRILKTKIGELLIERELITKEQLEQALKAQKENGGYISQHLISLGFVREENIAECLSNQYSFAYLPLASYEIQPKIMEIIPFKFLNIYSLLPVEKRGNTLSVVMADPLNEGVIDMLRQITGCEIQVFISTYTEIRQAIESYFHIEIQNANKSPVDEGRMFKGEMLKSFIQVKNFNNGKEMRKYKRKECKLDMVYFFQDKCYKGTTKNISYGGLLFTTEVFIPIEKNIYTNIVCNILQGNLTINSVVQVVRVQKIETPHSTDSQEAISQKYDIAGFFDFITDDDRRNLAILLE